MSTPMLELSSRVGIGILDGTLFVRVARLPFDRLRLVGEGEMVGLWDRDCTVPRWTCTTRGSLVVRAQFNY